MDIEIDLREDNLEIEIEKNEKVGGGTSDYNNLINKPQINGIELNGNKTLEDLGIKQKYTANDITFEDGENFQEKYNNGELKGEKGDKGESGTDGYSPLVNITTIENGHKVSITDKNGEKEFDVMNGQNGKDGADGQNGVDGQNGTDGQDGENGATFIPNVDEEGNISWTNDKNLPNPTTRNIQGKNGVDGKTPVKGIDYFTEEDKQEFVNLVLEALPNGNEVLY